LFSSGLVDRSGRYESFFDKLLSGPLRLDILESRFRRPSLNLVISGSSSQLAAASWRVVQAMAAVPDSSQYHDEKAQSQDVDTLIIALGLGGAREDTFLGVRFKPRSAIEQLLNDLSYLSRVNPEPLMTDQAAIGEARVDCRMALEAASNFHEAADWVLGSSAFGFAWARWINEESPAPIRAALVICLAAIRRFGAAWSREEIATAYADSKVVLEAAGQFRRALQLNAELADRWSHKRLKQALKIPKLFAEFIEEVAQYRRV
jgi:hypothetical protein